MRVAALIGAFVLASSAESAQAGTSPPMPDGFGTVRVTLAPELRPLDLILWRGKPVVGPLLYNRFSPPIDPDSRRTVQRQRAHYKHEAERYLFLLSLIKRYADNPDDFSPVSGNRHYFLSRAADAFLADHARPRYLQCPEEGLTGAPACSRPVAGALRDWKGQNEFEAEDSMVAFLSSFQKFMSGAAKIVPMEFWSIHEVHVTPYVAGSPLGRMGFKPKPNLKHVPKAIDNQYPYMCWLSRQEARDIVEKLGDDTPYVVAGLSLVSRQSSFAPDESFVDWDMNSLRLFKGDAIKEHVYTFDRTRSLR